MKKLILTLIYTSLLAAGQTVYAEKKSVDAVVIMDSSGSMKKTDPDNLRKPAAKLFISLLNEDDRASIMSFSDNGYPITYLNALDNEKNLQLTLDATDKVSTKGIYTNIHAAIERAYKILSTDKSDREPIIILLSDGKMDVGNNEKSLSLSKQLINDSLPKLNEAGIKVYSIAFTEHSDKDLLTTLSDGTQGFCKVAKNDSELHLAFTSIFEQSKEPDMLPLTENTFLADESIKEITIVASKSSPDSKIFLEDPEKLRFDASVNNKNIKWFISDTFDMITIKKPISGEWKILFSDNNNKAYIVADMSMKSKFDFNKENNIEKLKAQAWLEKDDSIVKEATILDSIEAKIEITSPTDKISTSPMGLALNDETLAGIFLGNNTPKEAGTYFATVTLKSQTFERQKTFSFQSEGTPAVIEPAPPVETIPAVTEEPKEEPAEEVKEPPPAEPEEEEGDLLQSVLVFLAINIIIIIIGLSIYLVIKLKKEKNTEAKDEPE